MENQSIDLGLLMARLGFSALAIIVLAGLALLFSSYVKIVTVLGILRAGLGLHSLPSAFVTGGLAFALSVFVMFPTLRDASRAMDAAAKSKPVISDVDRAAAVDAGMQEWRKFLKKHARAEELARFSDLAAQMQKRQAPASEKASPDSGAYAESFQVLAPAFFVSELRAAFATGLSLFVPLLIVDLVAAAALTAAGMETLNPHAVAFPFKLLLFVLLDGWTLITSNLVATYLT